MKTEIIEENGVKYEKTIYDDGSYTMLPWVDPDAPIPEPTPEPEPEPTDTDKIMMALTDVYEQNERIKEDNLMIMSALTDIYEGESTS